jgi:hypothetical protein
MKNIKKLQAWLRSAFRISLEDLSATKLTRVVYDLLQDPSLVKPYYYPPEGKEGFEWLAERFHLDRGPFRVRLAEILRGFLRELQDLERWPPSARDNLLAVVQLCGSSLDPLVGNEIYERVGFLEPRNEDEKRLLAGLLKCLIALEHKGWPGFWRAQSEKLGPRYGALIFAGLVEQGLKEAAQDLPRLCYDEEALGWIELLLPALYDRFGRPAVVSALLAQVDQMPSAARQRLLGLREEQQVAAAISARGVEHTPRQEAKPIYEKKVATETPARGVEQTLRQEAKSIYEPEVEAEVEVEAIVA